jgi:hypothetical protein
MAIITRQPYEVFKRNLMKARGLARLQFYLDDFLETGGSATLGKVQNFTNALMHDILGMDMEEIGQLIEPVVTDKLSSRIEELREEGEEQLETWAKKIEPHALAIIEIFEEIDLLRTRVLLEHAVVSAVTALHVYVQDVTVSAVKLNRYIENRFHKEIEKRLDRGILRETGYDSREAMGVAVSRTMDFYHPNDLRNHFRQMLDNDAILTEKKDRRMLGRIIAYRNLIVHQGGLVDAKFKSRTHYKGRLKEPVRLTRRRVENAISFIEELVSRIENEIRETRSPHR